MRVHIFTLLRLLVGSHSGDDGDEDPPVPIPNTEVKLIYGESSWHRAPARIANCRISINKRLQRNVAGAYFLCLEFYISVCNFLLADFFVFNAA